MSINISRLDLKGLTDLDKKILKELAEVVNNNEVLKDQFETYINVILERKEFGRAYEDDCANGTLLVIFYHYDYLTAFKESYKEDLKNGYIYIKEEE